MELQIGSNIKNLRTHKGMTQEDLARLLNVTAAAVSKWENQDTYPDISTLIPLAEIFGVTLDALMGYDVEKEAEEVAEILKEYNSLHALGKFCEASNLIAEAHRARANNYRIMGAYMRDVVSHHGIEFRAGELRKLIDCILDGCQDEQLRLDALFVKARLEFTAGRHQEAFEILDGFPLPTQTAAVKKAEILPQDSPKKLGYTRESALFLAEIAAKQYVVSVITDESVPLDERVKRLETLGDGLTALRTRTKEVVLAVMERMIFSHLRLRLIMLGADTAKLTELTAKELEAANAFHEMLAALDPDYDGRGCVRKIVNNYKNAVYPAYETLRESPDYMTLLEKWS